MSNAIAPGRDLNSKDKFKISKFLVQWEMILIYILMIINLVLMISKPTLYFGTGTIEAIIQSGMDLSFMVLAMILVLMIGDIDVSVASIMIVSAMVTGLMMDAKLSMPFCVICGIVAGGLCGAFNGVLIAFVKMPAVIATIASGMFFRGIVKIILDVNVLKNFPEFYTYIAWNSFLGIPIALELFLLMAILFVLFLHKTRFGRELYMVGNNSEASKYSGISIRRVRMTVFIIMGLMAGVSSIFFVGRMGGGVSSTMGVGYELNVIAICVLGGISTNGGRGRIYGPVISTLIMTFLIYTLGLLGVDANTRKIITGVILLIAVLIPNVNYELLAKVKLKYIYANNKNIEAINVKCLEEVKFIKQQIREINKNNTFSGKDKSIKNAEYLEKVIKIKSKAKQTTLMLESEISNGKSKSKKAVMKRHL